MTMTASAATALPKRHTSSRRLHLKLWQRAAGVVVVVLLAFLGLCQVLLPSVASHRLQGSLERQGAGVHVAIHASPAVELLAGRADSVTVHMERLDARGGHGGLPALLARAAGAGSVNATVSHLYTHGLLLEDVSFQKRGTAVSLSATLTRSAIAEALPGDIHLIGVPEGRSALNLTLAGRVFGHSVSATAHLGVIDGRLEVAPAVGFLEVFHFTLFDDPQVAVDTIRVSTGGGRYSFHAEGHYT